MICSSTGLDNTAGIGYNFVMTFQNNEGTSTENIDKIFHWDGAMVGTDDHAYSMQGCFTWQVPANKVRGISFFPSGDAFKYGEFILYGIS